VTQTGDAEKWKPGDRVYGVHGYRAHIVMAKPARADPWHTQTVCGLIVGDSWQGNDLFSETIRTCRRCKTWAP
jgi:hypothetical protein